MFIYILIVLMIKILEFMTPIILISINTKYIHGKKIWIKLLATLWYGILLLHYGGQVIQIYIQ